ncbi:cilia- and flagella-associated protein 58-like [Corticium candelabrum]|uniref:cilia- and flagella-associated protein 58-like n=1 Tax=Corticium candelabrum TaxID=121492 RepID=UPI002E252CA7|nr:cilia- and flagella-associated protein 58-like [Corticium candelabrum]
MEEEAKDGLAIEDNAFDGLERDFQQVLLELMGDKSLEKFRVEYEKLHRALKKSHEGEKRLMQRCRDLNAEITSRAAEVTGALKMSQRDQETLSKMKQEIEKAWSTVEASHEKENRARETIQQLKQEIENLSRLVEQGAGLTMGQEHSVQELLKLKDDLTKERDEKLAEVVKLREDLMGVTEQQKKAEHDRDEVESKVVELQEEIQRRQHDALREVRKKDKLERELKASKLDLDKQNAEIKLKQSQLQKLQEDVAKLEQDLKEARMLNERAAKDNDFFHQKLLRVQQDYEQQLYSFEAVSSENQQRQVELKVKEEEVVHLKQETAQISRQKERLQRKLHQIDEQKAEVERERDNLKGIIQGLDRELEQARKMAEQDRKAHDDVVRERDILTKNLRKTEAATEKAANMVKLNEQARKNLEQEIQNYKDEAVKQRKLIDKLEKERDRYINEAGDLTQKCLSATEEVKIREMQIFDMKKKIAESETKLKQQQNLYEAVRSDRNLYSKNLIEAQDEISEMKRKLKIMTHQIDQLKEEITAKEAALMKEHLEHQRVEKEKEGLKADLARMRDQSVKTREYLEMQASENKKLLKIIQQSDDEKKRQKKELDQVVNERDILGTQLIRRNDELALLYEKIKIQQSTLNKGEVQYRQRLEDIRILKLEIKKLRREKAMLSRTVANADELKRELYHCQRQLLQERTRCKALEEELENPMNIHRWRKLEGSDPSTFEMIQKTQMLQRRLIQKTEEVVEKELLIQEKEKLYMELKHVLARQPGPEVAEQLLLYQQTLKQKTKQLKSMASELNMYEDKVAEHKLDMSRLTREMEDIKKKYFQQKRREHQQREKERVIGQTAPPHIVHSQRSTEAMPTRFAGGGYSLKTPTGKAAA